MRDDQSPIKDDEIQVKLEGPHGAIDPRAVADAILALDKILRNVGVGQQPVLAITDLAVGSAQASIRSNEDHVATVRTGIESLTQGAGIPTGWRPESVTGLVELEHVSARRGVREVILKTSRTVAKIDAELARNAEASIAPSQPALGSVRGRLYRYNNNEGKRSAGIRDYRDGHTIDVTFGPSLTSAVRSALDLEVEAWGEIRRDILDQVKSITITGLEVIESSRARVMLDDVAGIFGTEWPEGLDPVQWVRQQRD